MKDRISSRISSAGTDAMSTCSSKDSLFPKISLSRGTIGGIPKSIDTAGMSKSVLSSEKRSTLNPKSGVISQAGDFSDEEIPAGSSVVTGIPSWDKGLNQSDKAALWWLHHESSVETEAINEINDSYPESPKIGFADDSLVSIAKLGGNASVLESLCIPEDDSNQSLSKSNNSKHVKHASVQTEGKVSVFPPDSIFSNGTGTLNSAIPGSLKLNSGSLVNSSSTLVQKNVANFLQNQSGKTPTKPLRATSISSANRQNTPPSGRSSSQDLSVPSLQKAGIIPMPPSFASPIKNMLAVVPVHRNQLENTLANHQQKVEAKRRILHGRKIAPVKNTQEVNYTQRSGSISSGGVRSNSMLSVNSASDDDRSIASIVSAATTRTGTTVVTRFKEGTPPVNNNNKLVEANVQDRRGVSKKLSLKTFKLAVSNSPPPSVDI